ncbi:helix-turn-helix domain-containing protein [uncultured Rhodoblastus sp.]|uniref:helix-turn-helix domain-containing protein n=1 Tax=uncultured Rhodoblastus sp. TaxID=543037 RepID=UPI0025F5013A|nr:helix-turn-helix domain-containing protein [uncultured Rhodoblastus sp.]
MTPEQCRAARGWLNWSQDDLAFAADVSISMVRDFEAGRPIPIGRNLGAMRATLEAAGIGFVFQNDRNEATACGIAFAKPETVAAH